MLTFDSELVEQGVSLLGVTFGMTKSDVKAMLGEPMNDAGAWEIRLDVVE